MIATMDEFTRGYLTAALWSSTGDDGASLDRNFDLSDIAPDTLASQLEQCERFQNENRILDEYDSETSGHDFWLTRNRHGAGFWDGDYGDDGEALTAAAHSYGELWPYVGDDGALYFQ